MESIIAVQEAIIIAEKIKKVLRADLAEMVIEKFMQEDYWMDRISPESYFSSYVHLVGFVYSIIINHISQEKKESKDGKE